MLTHAAREDASGCFLSCLEFFFQHTEGMLLLHETDVALAKANLPSDSSGLIKTLSSPH